MKIISSKYFLLLLVIILLSNQSYGQQIQQKSANAFDVGQIITGRSADGRVFSIVSVKELKSKYFFIRLDLDQDSKNFPIKLFIYLQGNVNPLKVCQQDEIDSCYLSKEQLKQNTNILLLTDSTQKSYGFSLRTYWSDIQHLKPNSETKFYFSQKDQSQLYHLELNDTNFYELRIILKPETIRSPFDKIKIYGSFGHNTTPSENQYDFKSIHLWQDAQGVFLYGKQVKQTNLNLLIVGQIQTVYLLNCEVIVKQHHDLQLGEIAHQYLEPGEEFMYHADFFKSDNTTTIQHLQFDEYVLTFSGFSGKLSLGFYLDQLRTQSLDIQPFEYLSDAQYVFKKVQIQTRMKKGLYLYVHSLERKSVYSINFYGRNKTSAIKLSENIHEFIQIDTKNPVLTYFQIYHWANDTTRKVFQYSVSMTNVLGQNDLEFRICTGDLEKCLSPAYFLKSSEIQNATVTSIGMKQTFSLSFSREALQNVNHAEDVITVLVVIKNKRFQKGNSFAALDYHSENRLQFLRESKPTQSRVKQGQYKIFKYQNQDRFLKEIKIYVNQIAGKVDVFSLRQEPNQQNRYGKEETTSVIVFDKDLATKPIYIVLQGKQESIISLQLVAVHKSSESISALTLTQDLQFSIKIKPQDSQIVEVSPVHAAIYFQYNSTGTVLVCGINSGANDCEKQFKPELTKSGEINISPFNARNKMFKIINPSMNDNVQVKLIYHSNDVVHCQQRQIGKLYYETIQKGQISQGGFQNNCYQFPVLQFKNIAVKLSRVDLGELHYAVAVCNSLVKTQSQISSDELRISGDKIQKECSNSNEKVITLMVSPHKNQTQKNTVIIASKIKYLVQYSDERVITIPDGIAYDFEGRTSELPIKIFYYDLVNKKDTTIKLNQYVGYGAFTVQIVHTAKKQGALQLTNYDYGFNKADSYFLNPTFTITKDMLSKKQCQECSLVIKVYSAQEIGVRVKFGIEVIQNHNVLQDHEPVDGFLTTNSMDFFTYNTLDSKTKGSLIVQVNDYGRKCMRIYLNDAEYPDEKNYIIKQEGNRLVYKDVQPQETYYISLQAVEDCPYSVTVSGTKVPITKLKRGYSSSLSLKAGQVKYFMLQHLEKKQFRILSILQHGQTYIYMNRTTPGDLQAMLMKQQKEINYKKFQVKSDFANRMVLHQNNTYLTENSIYVIAVETKQQTEGYLFYGDSNTNLQIISDTFVNDQLTVKGDIFRGEYYGQGNITLQLNVIAGELNLVINHPQGFKDFTDNLKFDKNFTQAQATYLSEFEVKSGNLTYFLRDPVEVKFTALKPSTVYSFRFVKKEPIQKQVIQNNNQANKTENNKTAQNDIFDSIPIKQIVSSSSSKIQPGQPNFIVVSNQSTFVITGTLTHGEEIFLSSTIELQQVLDRLSIKGLANKKQVKIKKTIVRNIMKVQLVDVSITKTDYKLEIKSNQDINLTVYQNYGLNLLSPDQSVLIQNTMDYVLYPQNSILIDLFECEDNATVLYSPTRSALDTLQPKSLDLIGMPNQPHAIKIINPGVTFLRVKSKKAYLRWLPIDVEKGKGIGYLDYDVGSILYQNSLLKFTVQWQPVFAKRDTITKIHQTNYVLIIGTDPASIKSAINCQNYNDPQLLYYHYNTGKQTSQKTLQIELSKTDITQKYAQDNNIFVALVAELVLRIPNEKYEKFEHYRFVYNTQQVPLQLFKQYTVTSKDTWIVALILAGVVFFISLTCFICVKKVMPIISRFRQGNVMIEERKDEKEFDVIPASSDRNEVVRDNLQTEDGMK